MKNIRKLVLQLVLSAALALPAIGIGSVAYAANPLGNIILDQAERAIDGDRRGYRDRRDYRYDRRHAYRNHHDNRRLYRPGAHPRHFDRRGPPGRRY